jgi:endonuclease/exonuclease/phosphatase family metal-dependent hydrolase
VVKQILLSAGLFIISCRGFAQQAQYQAVAIGFYNCENFFDTLDDPNKDDIENTPTPDVYQQKLHNIATVFQKLGTDVTPDGPAIIGIAEIENDNVLKAVIEQPEIKARKYNYAWFPTPDVRGISTAMLYNPKYFTLISSRPVHVPLETLGQTRPTRDVLYVCGTLAGDTVHILVNHWPSKSGGEARSAPGRKLAASVGKQLIDSILAINPNSKILLMGDLNDNPTSEGVIEVLKAKADKKDVGTTDIYNPWINMYKKGIGTESYQGEWNLIDQIMITGGFMQNKNNGWKYYKEEIFNKQFLTNQFGNDKGLPHRSYTVSHVWDNGFSDHYPVVMYFIRKQG